jgi:hypothetical protein
MKKLVNTTDTLDHHFLKNYHWKGERRKLKVFLKELLSPCTRYRWPAHY